LSGDELSLLDRKGLEALFEEPAELSDELLELYEKEHPESASVPLTKQTAAKPIKRPFIVRTMNYLYLFEKEHRIIQVDIIGQLD